MPDAEVCGSSYATDGPLQDQGFGIATCSVGDLAVILYQPRQQKPRSRDAPAAGRSIT
jgi:hypothetical protein